MIPNTKPQFRVELALFAEWHNQWRDHEGLDGATPDEIYYRRRPKHKSPRWEPRENWDRGSPCAGPNTLIKGKPGVKLTLEVDCLGGRKHLPVVQVRKAA